MHQREVKKLKPPTDRLSSRLHRVAHADGESLGRLTSSLCAVGLPHTRCFPRLQEVGPGTRQGVCG